VRRFSAIANIFTESAKQAWEDSKRAYEKKQAMLEERRRLAAEAFKSTRQYAELELADQRRQQRADEFYQQYEARRAAEKLKAEEAQQHQLSRLVDLFRAFHSSEGQARVEAALNYGKAKGWVDPLACGFKDDEAARRTFAELNDPVLRARFVKEDKS
jgi:hypothetical protein